MARMSPAEKLIRINQALGAWDELARNSTFFGMSFPRFVVAVKPSLEIREEIEDLQRRLNVAIRCRDVADVKSLDLVSNVVLSVKGNPEFGRDSALCAAMGYTRETERRSRIRSGRRRKKRVK